MKIKSGKYMVSIHHRRLIYLGPNESRDIDISDCMSSFVVSFEPFRGLPIDPFWDVVNLIKGYDEHFYFVKFPISAGSLEPRISVDMVFGEGKAEIVCTYVKVEDRKRKEIKMEERYDVFDGAFKVASDMKLEVALCLIKAYVKEYGSEIKGGISLVPMEKNQ